MYRLLSICLCLSLLVLAACQAAQPAPAPTATPVPATPAPVVVSPVAPKAAAPVGTLAPLKFTTKGGDGKSVASVNGVALSLADFEKEAAQVRDEYAKQGLDSSTAEGQKQLAQVYSQIYETMVAQELVRQGAKGQNVAVTDDEVKKELDTITVQQGGEEGLKKALEANSLTRDELLTLIRDRLLASKLAAALTKDLPTTGEQVHSRHILVKTEEEAKKVAARLAAGEDFASVAREVSTDPSGQSNGGDLGWLSRGQTVPPFDQAAFSLPLKKVSEPVQSQFGYHIIEVLEKDAARALPKEQVDQAREEKLVDWLEQQRKSAKIDQFVTFE